MQDPSVIKILQKQGEINDELDYAIVCLQSSVEEFEQTRDLIDEIGFDNAFVFKYSPRPGTRAADMTDDVSDDEKMRRNQDLLVRLDELGKNNVSWVFRKHILWY